jgi:hypothetical protein
MFIGGTMSCLPFRSMNMAAAYATAIRMS